MHALPRQFTAPRRRAAAVAAAAALLVAAAGAPAGAAVADQGDHRAFATGTVLHAEAVEQPELSDPESIRVVDADLAFSGAAHDAAGLPEQQTTEYGGTFQPAQTADETPVAGANAYGRGFGLDVSLGQEGQQDGQLTLAGLSEAVAPPTSELVRNEVGPVPADPLAYASTLRGEAQAIYEDGDVCPSLGGDISYGLGYAEDAQLVDQDGDPEGATDELEQPVVSTNAYDPDRAVSQSMSHTFLAPQSGPDGAVVGENLGVVAETRQTIAPVTLFAGTENQVTIEFLGEWVLRAVATGVPGTAHVHYGPAETSPTTPLVRILQPEEETTILTTQDIFGDEGLVIDALPLVSLAIGEDPRAIGGDAESQPVIAGDGTAASAAVDVVRVQFLSEGETGELTELRVGHMEVSAEAPAGGITCDLPVTKSSDEVEVSPGDSFTYTITVDNPNQCPLTNVRIVDDLTATEGVTWTVTGADPEPATLTDGQVVWEGLGPIAPGESLSVTMSVTVGDDSAAGVFRDDAAVTARCEGGPVDARTDVQTGVDLDGATTLEEPEVVLDGPAIQDTSIEGELAATGGGAVTGLLGLGAALVAVGLRRRR